MIQRECGYNDSDRRMKCEHPNKGNYDEISPSPILEQIPAGEGRHYPKRVSANGREDPPEVSGGVNKKGTAVKSSFFFCVKRML